MFKCWGWNGFGQLGLGDTANRGDGPDEMGVFLPLVQFVFTAQNFLRFANFFFQLSLNCPSVPQEYDT